MRKVVWSFVMVVLGMVAVLGTAYAGGGASCSNQAVMPISEEAQASGSVTMCVTRGGLKAQMRARDLMPGHAYTVWWVYFDDPGACATPGMCFVPDFLGENPQAVVGRMESAVAGRNGQAHFGGRVKGMVPSSGSQVWLFLYWHGPVNTTDGRQLARQLLTPEDPLLGTPHHGNSVDGQLGFPVALNIFDAD